MSLSPERMIREINRAAIKAVTPSVFLPEQMKMNGETLSIQGHEFHLDEYRHIYVIAFGKAAQSMTAAAEGVLGERITSGFVLTKHWEPDIPLSGKYTILRGGHPVPTEDSIESTEKILSFLQSTQKDDLILFLISGGGSALLTAPEEGISLSDWQAFSSIMLGCGADIREFNTLRKHLDRAKGGKLALAAQPSKCVSLILSDVVGNPLDVIASGPTVPDERTFWDALDVLERYKLREKMPASITDVLIRGTEGKIPETLKKEDERVSDLISLIAADNRRAAVAVVERARALGVDAVLVRNDLTGEASEIGAGLPSCFGSGHPLMVFGGETTVTLKGTGKGGRNQELALASVRRMAEIPGGILWTLATDGEDGPTDAAGAVVTSDTLRRGMEIGMIPEDYLAANNAYAYFDALGDLLKPGPTGTNVNDMTFLLRL